MKIAVLGQKQSILGFQALGAQTFGIDREEDLTVAREEIAKGDFAILLITEDAAQKFSQFVQSLYSQALPAVLVVPGVKGESVMAKKGLKQILERALGSDIIG